MLFASFNPYPIGSRLKIVVIDAGHGGSDPGCHGDKYLEKEVALAITLKLGKLIEENLKDVKVFYTRKSDVFVPLNEIAEHANKHNADLFICIHCNASVNREAYGSETYVMGLHKTKGNLEVAKRENAAILFEENYQKKYEGFDPESDEANIIFTMYQNAFLEHSLAYASHVQSEFRKNKNLTDKGVKQAGFLVLWKTSMPSVLIETGFLTNPQEERYLGSETGQDDIAKAIYLALLQYKAGLDGKKTSAHDAEQGLQQFNVVLPNDTISHSSQQAVIASDSLTNQNGLVYKVQFLASPTRISLNSARMRGLTSVEELLEEQNYKYLVGNKSTYNDVVKLQRMIRQKGFDDAFIVAYFHGKKITLKEAKAAEKDLQP